MSIHPSLPAYFVAVLLAGCSNGVTDTSVVGDLAAASTQSTIDPDYIELPIMNTGNEALPVASGQSISGILYPPQDGALTGIAVQIGNYAGGSNGSLRIEICQAQKCAAGETSVLGSRDNSFLSVPLAEPLDVAGLEPVNYSISRLSGEAPLALWTYPAKSNSSEIVVSDSARLNRDLNLALLYSGQP